MKVNHFITVDDSIKRTSKPTTRREISLIQQNLKTRKFINNIDELSHNIVENGYTWSPAIYAENYRNNKNWIQQSLFVLDFDDGITPEEVIKRLTEYNIKPNLLYATFSDSIELRKFRLILYIDKVIKEKATCKKIQKGLMLMFPECDKVSKMLNIKSQNKLIYINNI